MCGVYHRYSETYPSTSFALILDACNGLDAKKWYPMITSHCSLDAQALLLTLIFKVVFGSEKIPIHFSSGLAGRYSTSYFCSMYAIMSLISCTAKNLPGQLNLP